MRRPDRVFWLVIALVLLLGYAIAFCEPEVRTIAEITPSPTVRVVVIPERSPVPAYTSTVQPTVQPPEAIVSTPRPSATPTSTPSPTPTATATPIRTPVQRGSHELLRRYL